MATIPMMAQATLTPGDQRERVRVRNERSQHELHAVSCPTPSNQKQEIRTKPGRHQGVQADTGLVPWCPGKTAALVCTLSGHLGTPR